MLTVTDLNAGYGDAEVLHSISLTVNEGEAVIVLGPNGHGKTTLLRTISGLIRPTGGQVKFYDKVISGLSASDIVAEGVVHIPQGDLVFPEMTVLENLLMGAYRAAAWRERSQKLANIFELFPILDERKSQLARSLSGGERRMLAVGRGLMGKARILMIDEPSLGLAPLIIENLFKTIREINRNGQTILLVDENADHVKGLADRVYLLESGSLIREGTAEAMLRDEALLATYLG
jgi:branched-chain amino acid transport system ATP-binding protein